MVRGAGSGTDADAELLGLLAAIDVGDDAAVDAMLRSAHDLAMRPLRVGATRTDAERFFLATCRHQVVAGDTALHVAAAAHRREIAGRLLSAGAPVDARNRHGAAPLHYLADGPAGGLRQGCDDPALVVDDLVAHGAPVDVVDRRDVTPLHRAVRSRSTPVVAALLAHGADPRRPNGSGSTPLHLAVQNTGRSGSGSDAAHEAQPRIVALLLAHGADPSARDGRGRTVREAATGAAAALLPPAE